MIPWSLLPLQTRWAGALPALEAFPGPLWVWGEGGSGVSALGALLARERAGDFLDDADRLEGAAVERWILDHPRGVLGAHGDPQDPRLAAPASRCLVLRLASFEEDPRCIPACLEALAREEALEGPLPPSLGRLPCPGNLRGLRNRLVRWKILGQLPEELPPGGLPLAAEDLATNLHALERILLHRALRRSFGNRLEAAGRLGVSRRHLYLLIARHGDPVRGEGPTQGGPRRLEKARNRQNSSPGASDR